MFVQDIAAWVLRSCDTADHGEKPNLPARAMSALGHHRKICRVRKERGFAAPLIVRSMRCAKDIDNDVGDGNDDDGDDDDAAYVMMTTTTTTTLTIMMMRMIIMLTMMMTMMVTMATMMVMIIAM